MDDAVMDGSDLPNLIDNLSFRKNISLLQAEHIHMVNSLLPTVEKYMGHNDAAHDYNHALRVLDNALEIQKQHGGLTRVIIASALLHDIINYPKDNPRAELSASESADLAERELEVLVPDLTMQEVAGIKDAIAKHSAKNELSPTILESRIIQDADNLDKIGSIGIIRLYSYATYQRQMYHPSDPFNFHGRTYDSGRYALDYVFTTLRHIPKRLHTARAKELAIPRMDFIDSYVCRLYLELYGKEADGDHRERLTIRGVPAI